MPTDPKWRSISRRSGQPISCVIAVFNLLMVNACGSEERGALHNWDSEDAAAALDMEPIDVEAIISAMEGKVLDNGHLTGWEKRQPKREDNSAERVREYRKRNATQPSADVTQRNAPDTDTDTDILEPKGSCGSDEPPAASEDENQDVLKPEHIVEHFNELAAELGKPQIRKLTPERRTLLKARIAGYSLDEFREVFGNIRRSAFLRGDTGWKGCTFDWIFKKANFQKILEGNYNE